ncbi:pteridine reductase [Legionella quateirensis]|uniref:Pteridine reductase n=1 Tax=Legionella quateirensis TaxID=45072 RepID=A0A378KXT6_9GAMM|nr:pteridine reductase [Legionella quateirensis]KTD49269.1 pteridine reductase [Legionella quateirensis]STY19365.1 pteridine reductase 1 [Legionella quateirensis]
MNQNNKQEAKVALITGGARRVGAAIVKKLHGAGYKVVIHCRFSLKDAHALAVELNNKRVDSAFVLQRELTEENAAVEMISTVSEWAGRLDLLVNSASVFIRNDSETFSEEDWQKLFDTNVKAPFLLSLAAHPLLSKHSGVIINVTDIHAQKPLKGYSLYCQSKAALEMQTRSLAREFAPSIRVNAVAPGAIAWPEEANSLNEKERQNIIDKTPLKCHGDPEFIAQAILALAENPFITGQILNVDGGRSLMG